MYINYKIKGGIEYGMVVRSVRKGHTVQKEKPMYLGRVLDKEKCIFRSRERGVFAYDLETNTFHPLPEDYEVPAASRKKKTPVRPVNAVSFGDVYFFHAWLIQSGFASVVDAAAFHNPDTLHALLACCLLSPAAWDCAGDWWELTYAKYLYPKAQMDFQHVSEALAYMGREEVQRSFFQEYYRFLEKNGVGCPADGAARIGNGILIDAAYGRNSSVSEEVRLVYAVQRQTELPLFFHYDAENVIDGHTIVRMIAGLEMNGIHTELAVLDAGNYTGRNGDALLDAGVSFIARVRDDCTEYRQTVWNCPASLAAKENLVRFGGRLAYVKCVPCRIGGKKDRQAYAYLCRELPMGCEPEEYPADKAENDDLQSQGVFVLVSSCEISEDEILPLYCMKDQLKEFFPLSGRNAATEAAFGGCLMLMFMAAVIRKQMSNQLTGTSLTAEAMFMYLHEQHAVVYDDRFDIAAPTGKTKEAYRAFEIQCPAFLPRTDT